MKLPRATRNLPRWAALAATAWPWAANVSAQSPYYAPYQMTQGQPATTVPYAVPAAASGAMPTWEAPASPAQPAISGAWVFVPNAATPPAVWQAPMHQPAQTPTYTQARQYLPTPEYAPSMAGQAYAPIPQFVAANPYQVPSGHAPAAAPIAVAEVDVAAATGWYEAAWPTEGLPNSADAIQPAPAPGMESVVIEPTGPADPSGAWDVSPTTPNEWERPTPAGEVTDVAPELSPVPDMFASGAAAPPLDSAAWAASRRAERDAVVRRADAYNRRGVDLMARGAIFSARGEYIRALRLVSQAIDAERGGDTHSQALADALRALDEAEDFMPRGGAVEAHIDVAMVVSAHRTPVLKAVSVANMNSLAALQAYYDFARERFTTASCGEPVAASALYGLGKVCTIVNQQRSGAISAAEAKSMIFFQAALAGNPAQYMAANELAVLLARNGRYDVAKQLLWQGLAAESEPTLWHNLAAVHHYLGEENLSLAAKAEAERVALDRSRATLAGAQVATANPAVQWVTPQSFAATSQTPRPANIVAQPMPPRDDRKNTAFRFPWDRARQ